MLRVSAGPGQNDSVGRASPPQFRPSERPFAKRRRVAGGWPGSRVIERDMNRTINVFARPSPPVLGGRRILDKDAVGVEKVWPREACIG